MLDVDKVAALTEDARLLRHGGVTTSRANEMAGRIDWLLAQGARLQQERDQARDEVDDLQRHVRPEGWGFPR